MWALNQYGTIADIVTLYTIIYIYIYIIIYIYIYYKILLKVYLGSDDTLTDTTKKSPGSTV